LKRCRLDASAQPLPSSPLLPLLLLSQLLLAALASHLTLLAALCA
jgi:hypothetical protein